MWTKEQDEFVAAKTALNWTATEIAAELGISRNAVLGRRFRKGMCHKKPSVPSMKDAPSRQRPNLPEATVVEALTLRFLGYSRAKIAGILKVHDRSVENWESKYPDLRAKAEAAAKIIKADLEVKRASAKLARETAIQARAEEIERINTSLNLTARERQVVFMRNQGVTLDGIGKRLGITRERVRQIQAHAITNGAVVDGVSLSDLCMKKFRKSEPRTTAKRSGRGAEGWTPEKRQAAQDRMIAMKAAGIIGGRGKSRPFEQKTQAEKRKAIQRVEARLQAMLEASA